MTKENAKKEVAFEKLIDDLEKTVTKLENGDLSLEASLQSYENGVGLVRKAQSKLDAMEAKIEQLMQDGQKKPLEV